MPARVPIGSTYVDAWYILCWVFGGLFLLIALIVAGAVEGQAKTRGLRLKRRGARWDRRNVKPIAALMCVRHSAQWPAYWAIPRRLTPTE